MRTSLKQEELGTQHYGDGRMFLIALGGGEVGGMQVQPPHQSYFLSVILKRISYVFFNCSFKRIADQAYVLRAYVIMVAIR